jgi:hypothetical protein
MTTLLMMGFLGISSLPAFRTSRVSVLTTVYDYSPWTVSALVLCFAFTLSIFGRSLPNALLEEVAIWWVVDKIQLYGLNAT